MTLGDLPTALRHENAPAACAAHAGGTRMLTDGRADHIYRSDSDRDRTVRGSHRAGSTRLTSERSFQGQVDEQWGRVRERAQPRSPRRRGTRADPEALTTPEASPASSTTRDRGRRLLTAISAVAD